MDYIIFPIINITRLKNLSIIDITILNSFLDSKRARIKSITII